MSGDQSNDKLNRRTALKIGAAGFAAAGVPSIVSATDHTTSSDHVQAILDAPKVESISQAVGDFEVESVTEKQLEGDGLAATGTWLETDLGTLVYVESDGGETEARLDFADLSENPRLRQRLPTAFQNVPEGTDVVLVGNESSVSMVRTVTAREEQKLSQAVGSSSDIAHAVYDSELGQYRVFVGSPEADDDLQQYRVDAKGGDRAVPTLNAEQVVETQGCPFTSACGSCATWAVSKGLCYGTCFAGMGWSCLFCIANTNAALLFSDCDTCISNCA